MINECNLFWLLFQCYWIASFACILWAEQGSDIHCFVKGDSAKRSGSRLAWEDLSLSAEEGFFFDRPEHPPAGSLPPELCWDTLLHHKSSFQSQTLEILPQTSYVLHFLALTVSRTCKGSSQKTREVTGLRKGNSLHLRTLGVGLGWCHLRHCFSSWAQDHIQECFWHSQRLGVHVEREWSSCGVYISTHQCLSHDLSHITTGLHSAQQSQPYLARRSRLSPSPSLLKIFA